MNHHPDDDRVAELARWLIAAARLSLAPLRAGRNGTTPVNTVDIGGEKIWLRDLTPIKAGARR
jgi:hypothetical protein